MSSMAKNIYKKISFYVVPHADDWQLFMQPNAYRDLIVAGSKVVFIITTAGDAGNEKTYWSAREEGTKSSVRFCLAPRMALHESDGIKSFISHSINYWLCNNATCYFMRLPDGGLQGEGFARYNYQSLIKCKEETATPITAIDESTTYSNWQDLYNTIESIILAESAGNLHTCINFLNPDIKVNPDDHPDHIATGCAIQVMNIIPTIPHVLFTGYSVRNNLCSLTEEDYFWKVAMLAAYEKAVFDGSSYSTLKENIGIYMDWSRVPASFATVNG